VYVAAFVVGYVLSWITGSGSLYFGGSLGFALIALIWGVAWTLVIAAIFDYLAGTFGGTRGFDSAYAVVALAIVPSGLGGALGPIPWIGWLLSLGLGIYSLVLAYRFVPVFLGVPDDNRTKHFVISIIVALIVNLVIVLTIGSVFGPASSDFESSAGEDVAGAGAFGGLERQAKITQAAQSDVFEPPEDDKLTEAQVAAYANVMAKTRGLQQRLTRRFDDMEDGSEPSASDVFAGVGDAMRLTTAEMEVVKTGGGNWAEHTWVKNQIETARVQQDISEAVRHNYALFLEYEAQIDGTD
jgi:hypothetical protein